MNFHILITGTFLIFYKYSFVTATVLPFYVIIVPLFLVWSI